MEGGFTISGLVGSHMTKLGKSLDKADNFTECGTLLRAISIVLVKMESDQSNFQNLNAENAKALLDSLKKQPADATTLINKFVENNYGQLGTLLGTVGLTMAEERSGKTIGKALGYSKKFLRKLHDIYNNNQASRDLIFAMQGVPLDKQQMINDLEKGLSSAIEIDRGSVDEKFEKMAGQATGNVADDVCKDKIASLILQNFVASSLPLSIRPYWQTLTAARAKGPALEAAMQALGGIVSTGGAQPNVPEKAADLLASLSSTVTDAFSFVRGMSSNISGPEGLAFVLYVAVALCTTLLNADSKALRTLGFRRFSTNMVDARRVEENTLEVSSVDSEVPFLAGTTCKIGNEEYVVKSASFENDTATITLDRDVPEGEMRVAFRGIRDREIQWVLVMSAFSMWMMVHTLLVCQAQSCVRVMRQSVDRQLKGLCDDLEDCPFDVDFSSGVTTDIVEAVKEQLKQQAKAYLTAQGKSTKDVDRLFDQNLPFAQSVYVWRTMSIFCVLMAMISPSEVRDYAGLLRGSVMAGGGSEATIHIHGRPGCFYFERARDLTKGMPNVEVTEGMDLEHLHGLFPMSSSHTTSPFVYTTGPDRFVGGCTELEEYLQQ